MPLTASGKAAFACGALAALALLFGVAPRAETVATRQPEGALHGFLVLRSMAGTAIADGDLIQTVRGERVTVRLLFHFKDGSVHDETAVFSQHQQFHLLSDHLIQKGPAFPTQMDMSIDTASGQVAVRYTDEGQEKRDTERMALPPDLANGLVLTLLMNVSPDRPPKTFGYVAATPKPRLVKLALSTAGVDRFETEGRARSVQHYVLKVDIGGISGLLAPLVGKQPPDSHVWILGGDSPAFVKAEQQFYFGGPVWRIELATPTGP